MILLTLARLAASTASIVSTKASLTCGPQIGDIKNKSFPLKVLSYSTQTSPSANFLVFNST